MGLLSSFTRRAILFCGTVSALAVTTTAPLRSAALSGMHHGLHNATLASSKRTSHRASYAAYHLVRNGYWHTEGNKVVSEARTPVRITGVNWSGLETTAALPGGLDRQDYRTVLRTIADAGYNTVRVPFSNEVIEHPTVPSGIRFENETGSINANLEGLTSLQILDQVVFAAGELGLKVVLDNHRSEAGSSAEGNGLWYTEEYPEQSWIADWVKLAARYKGTPTVIGFDLRNEPHNANAGGACWDCGGARDWHLAAERAGNSILRTNPNLLIFVEGTDSVDGKSDFWGGNLAGVRRSPVRLAIANRVVYSPHVYGPAEFQQPWFNAATTSRSLMANWRGSWGFINESGMAPVWIGEFGTLNDDASVVSTTPGSEGQYFTTLIAYLQQHPEVGWSYWGINGEDRYGLLDPSYSAPANQQKAMALGSIRQLAGGVVSAPRTLAVADAVVPAIPMKKEPEASPAMTVEVVAPRPALIDVVYAPPALSQVTGPVSGGEPGRPRSSRDRAGRMHSHTTSDAVAEQVRIATEQALHNLSAE